MFYIIGQDYILYAGTERSTSTLSIDHVSFLFLIIN
jgi:hypothetical protein